MHASLRQLQMALSSLQTLENDSQRESPVPAAMPAGFDLITLNVEHTVNTKVVALRQLLQWTAYPAVVLLQETASFCSSVSVFAHLYKGPLFFCWGGHPVAS